MAPKTLEALSLSKIISERLDVYFNSHANSLPVNLYEVILAQVEEPLIKHTLRVTNGNQIKAADILGLNRNTLRKKIKLFKIDPSHYK
ncbi:MAG: DNA-binding protein [Candidatus Paracaedibacteraceae bacterium]|nr:DNA-binding protein [Candidatus Paracaedibacteraceae bacterium]